MAVTNLPTCQKDRYAINESRVFTLRQPGDFTDVLTEVLRSGARQLLAQAIKAEVKDFMAAHADETLDDGRQRLVRHGHLIGATPEGKKELIGFQTGYRESAQSWRELLVDLKARGLAVAPKLAIGDGALERFQ